MALPTLLPSTTGPAVQLPLARSMATAKSVPSVEEVATPETAEASSGTTTTSSTKELDDFVTGKTEEESSKYMKPTYDIDDLEDVLPETFEEIWRSFGIQDPQVL